MDKVFKGVTVLTVLFMLVISLNGCLGNIGEGPTISAAVTSGSCVDMTESSICTIQLTYNTNNIIGLTLGNTPSLSETGFNGYQTFSNSMNACNTQIAGSTGGQQICLININYVCDESKPDFNLTFTLGSATSNSIQLGSNC